MLILMTILSLGPVLPTKGKVGAGAWARAPRPPMQAKPQLLTKVILISNLSPLSTTASHALDMQVISAAAGLW